MIRVLLVDDHPMFRDGLATVIGGETDMQVVAQAGSGTEAVERFREARPDVTIMDLRMPGGTGLDAIRDIRDEFPEARIIVLTTFDTEEDLLEAVSAGAAGFALKDVRGRLLAQMIRDVHEGKLCVPPDLAHRALTRRTERRLSGREREVLSLVAEGHSNKIVADRLSMTENTVRTYLARIYEKLGVDDRTAAVVKALQRGLIRL